MSIATGSSPRFPEAKVDAIKPRLRRDGWIVARSVTLIDDAVLCHVDLSLTIGTGTDTAH
jgi:hypothetical protein